MQDLTSKNMKRKSKDGGNDIKNVSSARIDQSIWKNPQTYQVSEGDDSMHAPRVNSMERIDQ